MWFLQARCGLSFTIINHNQMSYNKCQAKSTGFSKYILAIKLPKKKRRQAVLKTKDDVVVPTDVVKIR